MELLRNLRGMKWTLLLLLLILSMPFNSDGRTQGNSHLQQITSRPNIIFIISDDQDYNDIGVYGSEKIYMPNLDQLAAEIR